MSTIFPMHRAVVPNRQQPRALRAGHIVELGLRLGDVLSIFASASLARWLVAGEGLGLDDAMMVVTTTLLGLIAFSSLGLYDPQRLRGPEAQSGRLAAGWLGVVAAAVTLAFLMQPGALPARDWVAVWTVLGLGGLFATRTALSAWVDRQRGLGRMGWNVIVVGSGSWGHEARSRLDGERLETQVVGYLELDNPMDPAAVEGALRQQLAAKPIDLVALALDPRDAGRVPEIVGLLRDFPVEVGVLPQIAGGHLPTLGHRRIGDVTSITCLEKPIDGWNWHLKSAFDRVAAAGLLAFLAPLLVVIGVAVKATSTGPVFFKQTRLGFNQQPIDVFKFRSMYTDRCDRTDAREVRQATRNDPRVTPLGAFLRRTSLDELPQLFNVLRGEMSLVGPRPHAVAHDEYYASLIDGYLGRHRAKPGITGWAQVNGYRGEIFSLEDMRRRIELDLHYIDNWSLWLDIRILLQTVMVCFRDENAY